VGRASAFDSYLAFAWLPYTATSSQRGRPRHGWFALLENPEATLFNDMQVLTVCVIESGVKDEFPGNFGIIRY
jgi:hypothetical protein